MFAKQKMPKGIMYIIGNEAAERFSYYGMRTILVVFMTKYLLDSQGNTAFMTEPQAITWFHTFAGFVYFFPLLGALISDIFWGKYKTIMTLSIVYCLGHLALAFMDISITASILEPKIWLAIGLGLISIGSGGIKPCVSAHVGDQFDESKKELLDKVFGFFYFAINFGSFFSTLMTPLLLKHYGPSVAFGVPGLLMLIATLVFYLGRRKFIAMPPVGWSTYKKEFMGPHGFWNSIRTGNLPRGLKVLLKLSGIYFFIAFFWSLFDQTGSSWVLQADKMDRVIDLGFVSFELLPSQIQAINPVLVMVFIPLFTLGIYPFFGKFTKVTPLRRIGVGFFVTALSFVLVAITEQWIQSGHSPSIIWQLLAFIIITAGEILISITALEFSYSQSPNSMKSLVMALFLFSVSIGNLITAAVNKFIQRSDGSVILEGASYYWFFAILITVAGLIYVFVASRYKEETFLQDHSKSYEHA